MFDKNKGTVDGRINKCKSCVKEYNEEYSNKNKEKIKNQKSNKYKSLSKEDKRALRYLRRYKITIDDYANILAKQNGVCAICRKEETGHKRRLSVDHCHSTSKVRGLLCNSCNNGLGRFNDDINLLAKAIGYLSK